MPMEQEERADMKNLVGPFLAVYSKRLRLPRLP